MSIPIHQAEDRADVFFGTIPGAPVYRDISVHGEFTEEWPAMNRVNFVFVPHGMTKELLEHLYKEFLLEDN